MAGSNTRSLAALDALGNPVRRELVEILRAGPQPVTDLAGQFDVSRPAISRHLKVLSDAGLVTAERYGRENRYALKRDGFDAIREYLDGFWDDALVRFRMLAENLDELPYQNRDD